MTKLRTMNPVKRIAFIVHADKKNELIEWSYFNKDLLKKHKIIAGGIAENILSGTLNVPVQKLSTDPLGGHEQLIGIIGEGKVDVVIFFLDPAEARPENDQLNTLLQSALQANIIIAFNRTTADFILTSELMTSNVDLNDTGESAYSPETTYRKNKRTRLTGIAS